MAAVAAARQQRSGSGQRNGSIGSTLAVAAMRRQRVGGSAMVAGSVAAAAAGSMAAWLRQWRQRRQHASSYQLGSSGGSLVGLLEM